jgi:biopolymer transport protein ExbD
VSDLQLQDRIGSKVAGQLDASIVLRSDKSVPVQYVVNVIDAVNNINKKYNTKHKVILATEPKR